MTRPFIAVLFLFCLTSDVSGQKIDYTRNITEIGNSDYGFILGSNKSGREYYFVLIKSKEEAFSPVLPFEVTGKTVNTNRKAYLVTEFSVQQYKIALYRFDRFSFASSGRSYTSSRYPAGPFKTLLDSERGPDLEVEDHVKSFTILNQAPYPPDIISCQFDNGGKVFRGMPVLDSKGNVIALIADPDTDKDRFNVISITAIRDNLIEQEKRTGVNCTYFNFLEEGMERNPCEQELYNDIQKRDSIERERKARKALDKQQLKAYNRSRTNAWSFGPAVGFHCSFNGLKDPEGGSYAGDLPLLKYTAGMNVFLAPDAKHLSFSLRPRYTWVKSEEGEEPYMPGLWLKNYRYELMEVPVYAELSFGKEQGSSLYLGLGYIPGYQTAIRFNYGNYDGLNKVGVMDTVENSEGFTHSASAELGINFTTFRFALAVTRQIGFAHKDHAVTYNGNDFKPFANLNKSFWQFGMELSFRLHGVWGIKNKRRPSEFAR